MRAGELERYKSDATFRETKKARSREYRRAHPRSTRPGIVYFVADLEAGFVKIGFTRKSLAERLRELQNGNPRPLTLIGQRVGAGRAERELHVQYASQRHRGEWFLISLELLEEARR